MRGRELTLARRVTRNYGPGANAGEADWVGVAARTVPRCRLSGWTGVKSPRVAVPVGMGVRRRPGRRRHRAPASAAPRRRRQAPRLLHAAVGPVAHDALLRARVAPDRAPRR